jgi:Xaa-Pro aminopeptidase
LSHAVSDHAVQRRQRLTQLLDAEQLDVFLISNPHNVTYLTGFSGESSCLLVSRPRTLLVSDGRFTEQIEQECPGLDAVIRAPSQPITDAVAAALGKLDVHNVGFESAHLTVAEYEALRSLLPAMSWKPGRDWVEHLRAIKDEGELAQIRQAIRIAQRAFTMFRAMLRPDDREKDLADALEMYVRRAGGKGTSFPSIVAVGERAALPHAPPTSKAVSEGDLLLVDWGASGPLYKSDLTRVLVTRNNSAFFRVPGREAETTLKEIYDVVLRAQARAIATLRPGIQAQEVDAAARATITEAGFGPLFTHSVGHGLGLQVHEAPLLRPGAETTLAAGMVVTIEPGIYIPGWGGIRIEDDVLITPDGAEVLTSVPKEFDLVSGEW